jgi:endonuclease/exonuclease/phosphatase family metal-dependent hydrolase
MMLRVGTYNIHRCVGCDGIEMPSRIAAVLAGMNADVVALQEVAYDSCGPKNRLTELARAVSAHAIAGPTLLEGKGHYGNAILSRIAPDQVERVDLSVTGREPRGAVAIQLRAGGSAVRVVATHLGLRPMERRLQLRRLLPLLDTPPATVTILLGDFNEWFLWGRTLRWLTHRFGRGFPAPATFPSRRPLLALDRIWVDPAKQLVSLSSYHARSADIASDHLPLLAKVSI